MPENGTNTPKVLIELEPEEISWLADRLHEEWQRTLAAEMVASTPENIAKVEQHKKMERKLRNLLLDKAYEQGFGNL